MMNVSIVGAGAVGAYFIECMSGVSDVQLTLLADGDRLLKLKNGLMINDVLYTPTTASPSDCPEFDLILVCVKYNALPETIELLKKVSSDHTIVLSLLNGVDSEDRISESGVKGHILRSVMRIASSRKGNCILFNAERTLGVTIGAETEEQKPFVNCVASLFEKCSVHYRVSDDILLDMWTKYASNAANNLPQAILGTGASLYIDSEHGKFLAGKLWDEVRMVASLKGITLSEEPLIFMESRTSRYSTLQDLEAGRKTEIDMLSGQLIKMAEAYGLSVPYSEFTYHAIKALEEKNDGLFNS